MAQHDYQVGDVVLVTRCYSMNIPPDIERNPNLTPKPRWAFVNLVRKNYSGSNQLRLDVEWVGTVVVNKDSEPIPYLLTELDQFTIPDPDTWPDEVCLFMANRKLMEKTNELEG